MVLQYRIKKGRKWQDYKGKEKLDKGVSNYEFRLLSKDRKKILVKQGNYAKVMKRFHQIEYFKNRGK